MPAAVPAPKKTKIRKAPLSLGPIAGEAGGPFLEQIAQLRGSYEALEREISEAKQAWIREQQQEETARKREAEAYHYETEFARRKEEDAFRERQEKWEKELAQRQEEIARERQELEDLRRQVAEFPEDKEKAIKEACAVLQKELDQRTQTENRLREQEFKAQQEILNLKIGNLTEENGRLQKEVESLKRSLEEATRQLKEIAVKVIESGGNIPEPNQLTNPKG
jgi:chromosome segregation ATPase